MEKGRKYLKLAGELLLLAALVGGLAFVFTRLRAAPETGSSVAPTELILAPTELYPAPTEPYPPPELPIGSPSDPYPGPEAPVVSEGAMLTPIPYPGPGDPPPTPTAVPVPKCVFDQPDNLSGEPQTAVSYIFSEPEVVLTNKSLIQVLEWLPDGQRLLLIQRVPKSARVHYDVFDTLTGKIQRYGEGHAIGTVNTSNNPAVWMDEGQGVVFVDFDLNNTHNGYFLRHSLGDEQPVSIVSRDLAGSYLALTQDGMQTIYFLKDDQKSPQAFSPEASKVDEFTYWDWLTPTPRIEHPDFTQTHLLWQPEGNYLAVHNMGGLYLTTPSGKEACEVDLGAEWVAQAQWSPDGRYLAMRVAQGRLPVPYLRLLVLDTHNGDITPILSDKSVINAIAWAPDGKHLLAVTRHKDSPYQASLYLINVSIGTSDQILGEYDFYLPAGTNLAWSPRGDIVAISCSLLADNNLPPLTEGRLCLIPVEEK